MAIETEKYIRKPLIVDAVRITTENFDEVASWCMGEVATEDVPNKGTRKFIRVRVNNPKNPRQTKGFVGDWILYTDRGYKVYTNKAFHQAFDLLQNDGMTTPPTPIEAVAESQEPSNEEDLHTPIAPPPTPAITPPQAETRLVTETSENQKIKHEPVFGSDAERRRFEALHAELEEKDATASKRVLSVEEQQNMGQDAVREMLSSGEAVLAQDLAESQ